ncbi:MAG: SpoIIE family protein phosphatase [Turneriella sp.]
MHSKADLPASTAPRRRISIITKIFSVFLAITALDISAIYVFVGTGQIDQLSRNGLLIAENAALRMVTAISRMSGAQGDDVRLLKLVAASAEGSEVRLSDCRAIQSDGRVAGEPNGKVSGVALKALRLYESEQRLFFTDMKANEFSAAVYVPFKTAGSAQVRVLTCNVALESIREAFERLLRLSLIILSVTLLMQAGLAWFIYFVFLRRLRVLEKSTDLIARGDFSGDWKPGSRFDEIDQLGHRFNEMRLALAEKTRVLEDTLVNLEKVNFDLEGDLILGQEIQRSILPPAVAGRHVRWCVTYRPLSKVSGDFYDVYDLADGATGILQFDASGHGVPAALLTMMAKISFVEAIQKVEQPNQVIAAVNDELASHLQMTGNFLTAFYAVIRPHGRMIYCNAAHTSILVLRRDKPGAEILDPTSLSVGFAPPGPGAFHNGEVLLRKGDRIIVYSDGLTETRDKTGKQFGVEGLLRLVEKYGKLELAEMHAAIAEAWSLAVERSGIDDDVTFISAELS